jgi:hypothetical protein
MFSIGNFQYVILDLAAPLQVKEVVEI